MLKIILLFFKLKVDVENNYCVCLKSKTLRNCRSSSFLHYFFQNNGEFGAKKYFTDHRTADTNQLFVPGLFFF